MSVLQAWWGELGGREAVLVARSAADAARLAGVKQADLPFRFGRTTLPQGADRPGVYRGVGSAWVRERRPSGPPDLEDDR